jgi:hypothetical protein
MPLVSKEGEQAQTTSKTSSFSLLSSRPCEFPYYNIVRARFCPHCEIMLIDIYPAMLDAKSTRNSLLEFSLQFRTFESLFVPRHTHIYQHVSPPVFEITLPTTPCSRTLLVSSSPELSVLFAQSLFHEDPHHHHDQSATTLSSTPHNARPEVPHGGYGERTLQLYDRAFPVHLLHLVSSLSNL